MKELGVVMVLNTLFVLGCVLLCLSAVLPAAVPVFLCLFPRSFKGLLF